MTRRLLAVLIVVVGLAGVAVAALSSSVTTEDRGATTHPGPIRSVEVDIDAGRVEVVGTADPDVAVDRVRHYLGRAPSISEAVTDGVLRLRTDCPRFIALQCRVDVGLLVPAGAAVLSLARPAARVDLRTHAGSIDLALPAAPGGYRLTATTGSGKPDVSVAHEPTSARAVTARTGAGSIRIHAR